MRLKLSKEIYSLTQIQSAVEAYKEYATIVIQFKDKYYQCIFAECINDESDTIKEFENYLISLQN